MSATGSSFPATCTMSLSSKQRTTWTIASTSRMCCRNLLPRPSPFEAPRTRPAMSTNSMVAGMIFVRLGDLRERLEARVGHGDDAHVGLDRAERVVRRFGLARARQGVEEGGLADVRQPDDSGAQHRAGSLCDDGRRYDSSNVSSTTPEKAPGFPPRRLALGDRGAVGQRRHRERRLPDPARRGGASSGPDEHLGDSRRGGRGAAARPLLRRGRRASSTGRAARSSTRARRSATSSASRSAG